jgi:hypothetical protein
MNRSDRENGMNELEPRDTDDVSNLLGALPRVEAPANFEFGVKARIAAGAASPQASLVPFLKIAAPLSFVLLLAAFVIFYGIVPTSDNAPPVASADPTQNDVAVSMPDARQEQSPQVSGSQAAETVDVPAVTPSIATGEPKRQRPVRRTGRAGSVAVSQGGRDGSVDLAIRPANVILPRGFQSVTQPNRDANAANVDAGREIPIREVLEMLGVKAEFADGGWTVLSTADNSIATRSGVRSKDVIEAFNDQDLTEGTTLKAGFAGKSLRVRRDGKRVKLDLKN